MRHERQSQRVVLKLMYYDARQEGDPVNLDDYDFVASPPIARFIQPEADCYAALERCQGSILPFCLGSYEFQLANGHRWILQVLEYVNGLPPSSLTKSLRLGIDDDKIDAFLTNSHQTLIELHKASVIHKDQASRNIRLLYPLDPLNPQFAIFDFSHSVLAKDWQTTPEYEEQHWLDMDEKRMLWFWEECGPVFETAARRWQASPKGAELVKRWKTHPDDLSAGNRAHSWYHA